jgi:hypothetical protein
MFTHDNVDQAFNSGTSIAAGDLTSDAENVDMSWSSYANGPSGNNFDFMDASDQGYSYHDMGHLARLLRISVEYPISPRKTSFLTVSAERGPNQRNLPYN